MMGKLLCYKDAVYTVCAQPECGMLFKINMFTATMNKYGPRCTSCTEIARDSYHNLPGFIRQLSQGLIRASGVLSAEDGKREIITASKLCCICNEEVKLDRPIYVYGCDLFVCHRTRKHRMKFQSGHKTYQSFSSVIIERLIKAEHPICIDPTIMIGSPGAFNDSMVKEMIIDLYITIKEQNQKLKVSKSKQNTHNWKARVTANSHRK